MIKEEQRIAILKKYLPQEYLNIYLFLLYDDVNYLPDRLKRPDSSRRVVKQVELNKEIANLTIILARAIIDEFGDV